VSGSPDDPQGAARRAMRAAVLGPLALTVLLQSMTAFGLHSASIFAPIVGPALDIAPERVSVYVLFAYGAASLVGLGCSGLIARLGPLRIVQIALLGPALGLASAAVGWWPVLLASAMLIGAGNGFTGPVCSHILVQRTPRHVLGLVLSVKQAGVPIGAGIAGALIPALSLAIGWQTALLVLAAAFVLWAIVLQPLRSDYDRTRDRSVRISVGETFRQMRSSLVLVLTHRHLRDLSFACLAYVAIQWVALTFMVSFLHVKLGFPLVTAGLVFAAAQFVGIPGRLLWGFVGDRVRNPMALLGWLGVAMAVFAAMMGFWTAAWPIELIVLVSVLFGVTGVSWNGLFFAEVARTVKIEDVSRATGGGQFIGFLGGMFGPLVFDFVATASGSFGPAYFVSALLPFVIGLRLLITSRAGRAAR